MGAQGSVIEAWLPGVDGKLKGRPAVVLSTLQFTTAVGLVIVVGVFTEAHTDGARAAIPVKAESGQPIHGFAQSDVLLTVPDKLTRKSTTVLPKTLSAQVVAAVRKNLGF